jgi:hypothetical protein
MNKEFKIVLSGHAKSSRCKCINCYFGITDIFNSNLLNNKAKSVDEDIAFREVSSEKFEKGNLIL